jgi:hypothetical protein
MVLVELREGTEAVELNDGPFPREVEFIISALEAGPRPLVDRHRLPRSPYRRRALLRLYSDPPGGRPYLLYTRDVSTCAIGFLAARPVTLSHGGVLTIPSPYGKVMNVSCTVLRCREAVPGWFEGAIYFNRPQNLFGPENILPDGP